MSYYVHHTQQQQQQAYAPPHAQHHHPQQQQQAYGPPQGQFANPQAYQPQTQYMNQPPVQYGPPSNPSMQPQQHPPAQYMPQGPPQPYPSMAGPRMLHVYTKGYSRSHIEILDCDKHTVLYTIENSSSSSKPQTKIFAGNGGNLIGTVSFHSMSSKIDVQVHGVSITIEEKGFFSSGHEYSSPAFGGARLKWKLHGNIHSNLVCEHQGNSQTVATFLETVMATKEEGKFELGPMVAGGGPAMDEVVVAGVAIVEARHRHSAGGGA